MENQEALTLIREIVAPGELSYIEELVIYHSWEGKRYREMALETGYEEGYLRDTGSRLWQALSANLGYQVTKKRLRYILMDIVRSQPTPTTAPQSQPTPTTAPQPQPTPTTAPQSQPTPTTAPKDHGMQAQLESAPPSNSGQSAYPGFPLPFGSPLYIKRSPVEELAVSAIQQPGGLLRIKAPWRMGKTSLINYLLGHCQQLGYHTVMIDIRQVDTTAFANLNAFFRWFCWSINQQLGLTDNLDDYWFDDAGSKLNCTTYVQEQVLASAKAPVIIAIDTGHYLMEYPVIAKNFFSMLRSWYEQARVRPHWQNLRLVLAHVADLDLPLHAHQSPFNVGLLVELPYFTPQHIQLLRESHPLGETQGEKAAAIKSIAKLVGGHPYLIQLAFYWLCSGQLSPSHVLHTAATNQGIYREYLRRLWSAIQEDSALLEAFYQVLVSAAPVNLNPKQAYALADMGLVDLTGHQVKLRCELYRAYFGPCLELECG